MKKLFISQPMRDKSDAYIQFEREKAKAKVEEILGEEVEVIDSFFIGAPHDADPLWFLGESIKLLGNADVVYFCEGWEDYRGCKVERFVAEQYGKRILAVRDVF